MPANTDELATAYAALILSDSGAPISADGITAICKAANVKVSPLWPKLYQQVFENRKVSDFLVAGVSSGGAPAAAAPAAAAVPAKAEAKKEEKEEKKEESDEDMGFVLHAHSMGIELVGSECTWVTTEQGDVIYPVERKVGPRGPHQLYVNVVF